VSRINSFYGTVPGLPARGPCKNTDKDALPLNSRVRLTGDQTDTDRQTDRQTSRQTDRQKDRKREQRDRQTDRPMDRQTDRWTDGRTTATPSGAASPTAHAKQHPAESPLYFDDFSLRLGHRTSNQNASVIRGAFYDL